MKRFSLFLIFVMALGLFCPLAVAKIELQTDFKGTIVITLPNGEVQVLEAGDKIPDIPSKSVVEVFDGEFILNTAQGDSVQSSCLDHDALVENGASISLSCSEKSGLLKALKGSVQLTDPAGQIKTLTETSEYAIQGEEQTAAPATGAGAAPGGAPAGGDLAQAPPTDSRSLEASPS